MACMTSGASSVTLQSLYWRSSNNFSVPAESSRVNWCSPARRLEDEILESRSLFKGRWSKWHLLVLSERQSTHMRLPSPCGEGCRWCAAEDQSAALTGEAARVDGARRIGELS